MDKKLNLIKSVALCVIAFCMAVAGYLFWEHRNYKEPVVVSEYITEVKKLSDYFDGVKGTTNDCNVYNAAKQSFNTPEAVGTTRINKEVSHTEFYSIQGFRLLSEPTDGIYIARIIYTDGSAAVIKRVARR